MRPNSGPSWASENGPLSGSGFGSARLAGPGVLAIDGRCAGSAARPGWVERLNERTARALAGKPAHEAEREAAVDGGLVDAVLSGDRGAFGGLVQRYQRRVFALAFRFVGNEPDAADLTQRAFLRAFERLGDLKRREAFAPWLFRMTANLAKNEIRFQASRAHEDIHENPVGVAAAAQSEVETRAEREELRRALAELPEKQRQCVMLRIDGELSFKEIGEAVGCSEVSARVNFHHALRTLQRLLGPATAGGAP